MYKLSVKCDKIPYDTDVFVTITLVLDNTAESTVTVTGHGKLNGPDYGYVDCQLHENRLVIILYDHVYKDHTFNWQDALHMHHAWDLIRIFADSNSPSYADQLVAYNTALLYELYFNLIITDEDVVNGRDWFITPAFWVGANYISEAVNNIKEAECATKYANDSDIEVHDSRLYRYNSVLDRGRRILAKECQTGNNNRYITSKFGSNYNFYKGVDALQRAASILDAGDAMQLQLCIDTLM